MPIKAPLKQGSDFSPLSSGTHHAVCYGVVDLGTQPSTMFEPSRKVLILWEVPEERIDITRDGETVNIPRAISQSFTLSMHVKSNLRAFLASWSGKPFTDEEAADFDIAKLVGANCLLGVVHKNGKGQNADKVYANVSSVAPLMKGMVKRQRENPTLIFSLDDFANKTITFPENMPEWIQKKINDSEEFTARARGVHDTGNSESFESVQPASKSRGTDDGSAFGSRNRGEEDVPF